MARPLPTAADLRTTRRYPETPKPKRRDYADDDTWRAAVMGWWAQQNRVSLDKLARWSGVSRTTIGALFGSGDATTWSRVKPATVEKLAAVLPVVDMDMDAQGLRELLSLSDSPAFYTEGWRSGTVKGTATVLWPLTIIYHGGRRTGPQVYRSDSGQILIAGPGLGGMERLGGLIRMEGLED